MGRISKILFSVFLASSAVLASASGVHGEEALKLKRVMLSTGGVGYFELEATVAIAPLRLDRVLYYAQSAALSPGVRKAFAKVAGLRRAVDDVRRRIRDLDKQKDDLFKDQKRIRDNLKNVSKNSDIYRRYVDKLNGQENRLEDIAENKVKAAERLEKATQALNAYVAKLKI